MATVGQQLAAPEAGWIRYDELDTRVALTSYIRLTQSGNWNGAQSYSDDPNALMTIKFYGTKIRLIAQNNTVASGRTPSITITVDGVPTVTNAHISGSVVYMVLIYEKTGLPLGYHTLTMRKTGTDGGRICIDAVDIEDTGFLVHPTLPEKFSLDNLEVGDVINCEYNNTVSGAIGTFSNIGTSKKTMLPVTPAATNAGSFYLIHTGYDRQGRMKLVADRNIQSGLAWNTLNTAGFVSGNGAPVYPLDYNLVPPMTSNTSPAPYTIGGSPGADSYMFFRSGGSDIAVANGTYLTIDLGTPAIVGALSIMVTNSSYLANGPSDIVVEGSDDGATWVAVDSKFGVGSYAAAVSKVIPVANTRAYRHYKITLSNIVKGATRLAHVELLTEQYRSQYAISCRCLTGGYFAIDLDNEWYKIVVGSSLNGLITPGATAIWNWSPASMTSSTNSVGTRSIRGGTAVTTLAALDPSTGGNFRPVFTAAMLNSSPFMQLEADSDTTHNTDVVVSGDITDVENNNISYRVILNGTVLAGWSAFASSPITLNYTIPGDLFITSLNSIRIEAMDQYGATSAWLKTVQFMNETPTTTTILDKPSTFDAPINITGDILDSDGDPVQYRILVNDVVRYDWSTPLDAPVSVSKVILASDLVVGTNTIRFEYKDSYESGGSWTSEVIRKDIDSFYVSENTCFNHSTSLKAGGSYVAYLKMPGDNPAAGYVRSSELLFNIINGSGGSGTLKVAPLLSDWSSSTASMNNLPIIDIDNILDISVTNTTGLSGADATELLEKMSGRELFGIVIYSTGFSIETSVVGNTIDIMYQPTELILPEIVYGNRVNIQWKPIILLKPEAFVKVVVRRSTSSNFDSAITVAEIANIEVENFEDTTVSIGTYYYELEIHLASIAFQGNQLDFDFSDRSQFVEQDSVYGTNFVGGVVKMASSGMPETFAIGGYYVRTDTNSFNTLDWNRLNSVSISQTVQEGSDIRYAFSRDGKSTWEVYDDGWKFVELNDLADYGMTASEVEGLSSEQWDTMIWNNSLDTLDVVIFLKNTNSLTSPSVDQISFDYDQIITPVDTESIVIPVPNKGYRNVLVEGLYTLKLAQGIAYDDASVDYDFFTTPDRIKIKPLVIGTVVGGKTSPIYVFEVINTYDIGTFDIYLRAAKAGQIASEHETYCLLPDAFVDAEKTKVEMSLTPDEYFNPVYPLVFRLRPNEKRLVYIRVKPTLTTVGNDSFQITLSGRPV